MKVFASPNSLTYQGRILKSDGTPLEYNNVSFLFEITNPSGNCVLYREQRNTVNMMNSGGVFDVPIGSGTKLYPTDPLYTLLDSFNNSKVQNCDGGATYTPAQGDIRLLKVQFHDGVGWKAVSPSSEIRSVPYAAFSLATEKLGTKTENDFVAKTLLPTCAAGTFLAWDGTNFSCNAVSGASGGTVTDVTSANSYLTIINNTSTPLLTLNVGTSANTVAAGNDSRFTDARTPTGSAGGDLSGTYPNPSVAKIQGTDLGISAPASGQFLKYSGSQWVNSAIAISDVTNLSSTLSGYLTTAAFDTAVGSANCAVHETPYWSSVAGKFLCQAINVSVAGDVSGTIGAVSVNKIKGVSVDSTVPTTGQVLKYDGTKWAPAADNNGGGTVTNVSGTAPISVASGTTTPTISISQATTSTNGYLSSTDWNTFNNKQAAGNYITALTGDVTATGPNSAAATVAKLQGTTLTITSPSTGQYLRHNGTAFVNSALNASDLSGTISASNIPNLDWSKITTGKPTTLSGYGITDSLVSNAGGTPSVQTGLDASKPASPTAGSIYFATDTNKIYQYNSGAWSVMASASGSGGTITGVTAGTGLSGGGTSGNVTLSLPNSGVAAGSYTRASITVDAQGRITTASNGAAINLTSDVTGVLPITNGGTGANTAVTAFNALSPITAKGALITNDGTNDVSLAVGTNGQVLSADSTQAGGLKWITPTTGTVTSVTGTLPIVVATGTSTPVISVNDATTSAKGVVQVGSGIAVSSGTISADPANFPSAVPVTKGGTGATSMTANRLVASDGTGSSYTPFTCGVGQTITFNASGVPGCQTFTAAGFYINGGNSFGGAATLGTNDANSLSLKTNNSVAMTIDTTGKVGIGSTVPSDLLTISQADGSGGLTIFNNSSTASRSPGIMIKNYTGTFSGGGDLIFENARGSSVSATAVASGDNLGQILFQGLRSGSSYSTGAQIYAQASENWTSSTSGTNLIFGTISSGSTSVTERMRLDGNTGRFGIGASSPNNLLQVGPTGSQSSKYGVYVGSYLSSAGQASYVGNWTSSGYWGIGPATNASDNALRIGISADQQGTWATTQNINLQIGGTVTTSYEGGDAAYWAKSSTSGSANSGGSFIGTRTRGTLAAPTHPLANDLLAQFLGKNGITNTANPGMVIWASENQSATALGDYITFYTTPNGATASLQRMRITNDGKVGIGTSNPGNLLTLANATSGSRLLNIMPVGTASDQRASMLFGDYEVGQDSMVNGTKDFYIWDANGPATRFHINTSGWVSFNKGGSNPAIAPFTLYNATAPYMGYEEADTGQRFYVGVDASHFWIRPGPTTASANAFTVSPGGLVMINAATNPSSLNFWVNGTAGGTSAYQNLSDKRLKTHVEVIPQALEKVLQLRGVTFDWQQDVRPDLNLPKNRDMGVIAQEVEAQFPEAVQTDSQGFKSVAYTKLIGPLIESTKELAGLCKLNDSQIAKLQNLIEKQEREIASVKKENAELRQAICEVNPKAKICKK
ncbi:tail fiber domain-containing protein [Bdellovibrio bacteriovorus]|uniref:tail fiber domain-containing protein n=1 Tax=Bdellovibrio bacteriovorus TaxID=959 RepID=UPI0035A6C88E